VPEGGGGGGLYHAVLLTMLLKEELCIIIIKCGINHMVPTLVGHYQLQQIDAGKIKEPSHNVGDFNRLS
jgi:hypothetical protein